jgi:hypothetical protein
LNRLTSKNGFFADSQDGRIYLLRGINLSGSTKVPFHPDGNTAIDQTLSFQEHEKVSFIGRPFPEEEAVSHYTRLRKWGFNFIRFLVTWEAVEHGGPGVYDEAYIDYVGRMVELAEKMGFYVFIDPHQDVWSRFTGGDGAPGWTLESVGMDVKKIPQGDFANLQYVKGKKYTQMSWPLNYAKYATATMFTLFFGGDVFAPNRKVGEENLKDYLQGKYIEAMCKLAIRLKNCKNVVGFDTLNEPSPGYIGKKTLSTFDWPFIGVIDTPTSFQEMVITEGNPTRIKRSYMVGFFKAPFGSTVLNKRGINLWKNKEGCVWRQHGVWNYDPNGAPMLLKSDYFEKVNGQTVSFYKDFVTPFVKKYKNEIQKIEKSFFIFMESDPSKLELEWSEPIQKGYGGVVNATHWYDGALLFMKREFNWLGIHSFSQKPIFGKKAVEAMFFECISEIKNMSIENMQNAPTVIGETGIPMDLSKKYGYRTGDYSQHEKALDKIMVAIEKTLVNVTLWNYTSDNTHKYGDNWNGEDLSIYSKDTPVSYDKDGGRGVRAFSRPYAVWTIGEPVAISFDYQKSLFKYSFKCTDNKIGECAIFLPNLHYGQGYNISINAGTYDLSEDGTLLYFKGIEYIELYGITIYPKEKLSLEKLKENNSQKK